MPGKLTITADWETLDDGTAEERACFAAVEIRYDGASLTQAHDLFVNRVRTAPLLSAYHLAEWIAWNWWRLRWEPRTDAQDWPFAHRLATIAAGYVWPDITVFSDGERVALIARPTPATANATYRYLSDVAAVLSARDFEETVDRFIAQVCGQLRAEEIEATNLDRIWEDVVTERHDPETAKRRRLEALLGYDPDEADPRAIDRLISDARLLGETPMNEVAADTARGSEPLTGDLLNDMAQSSGFDIAPRDAVRLAAGTGLPRSGEVPAWALGARAARALRDQERLRQEPISNERLARLAAVQSSAITANVSGRAMAFALDTGVNAGRVVLRSKWEAGRRFEVARLLGDRIVAPTGGRLFPATRSNTYRQKMQRSFAAELLSPFDAVDELLAGDYSMESQQDAAAHFHVSELQIRTLLVNHGRLGSEELDLDFDVAAA